MRNIQYRVVIQKNEENNGYWAYCPDLPGCNSIGDTLRETRRNVREAIHGYLEVLKLKKRIIPRPKKKNLLVEKVSVEA